MSNTGTWGDKIIIILPTDGIRRHKTWCEHYRSSDKYCTRLCHRCIGSAHCDHYISKIREELPSAPIRLSPSTPSFPTAQPVDPPPPPLKKPTMQEHYRLARYGDKLLGQTVLIWKNAFSFKICDVVAEDHRSFITLEKDQKQHSYQKSLAFRKKAVYVFIEAVPEDVAGEEL